MFNRNCNMLNTPDRQITPDFDDHIQCEVCNGTGKILIPNDDEGDEDGWPDFETCTACEGEGVVNEND